MRALSTMGTAAVLGDVHHSRTEQTSTRREGFLDRLGAGAAACSLLGILAASLVIVVLAADRPSPLAPISRPGFFPSWMAGPLGGLWPGPGLAPGTLAWVASALMVTMYVLYVIASAGAPRLRARWTLCTVIAIHLIFLLSPPLAYTDVFNYIDYGRMGVVHHLNPYVTVPLLEPHTDPSFALSNWHLLLSPYGPLFTLITYALVPLGVVVSFWVLKLAIAVSSLATLALVWRCAELLGRSPSGAVVLVGCNPIVLIWGLGADHNDTFMVFFIVLSAYLLLRPMGSSRGAGIALVCASFIKASALVLVPLLLLVGERRCFLRGGLEAGAVLGAASLIAFGTHLPNVSTQSHLVTGIGLPNLAGLALGLGGETDALRMVISVLLVLLLACCALRVARDRCDWLAVAGVAVLGLLVSLSWSAPWYLLWLLPFAALTRTPWLRRASLVYGAYLIVAFMPAAPMLAHAIHFAPDSTHLGAEHRHTIETLVR